MNPYVFFTFDIFKKFLEKINAEDREISYIRSGDGELRTGNGVLEAGDGKYK